MVAVTFASRNTGVPEVGNLVVCRRMGGEGENGRQWCYTNEARNGDVMFSYTAPFTDSENSVIVSGWSVWLILTWRAIGRVTNLGMQLWAWKAFGRSTPKKIYSVAVWYRFE